MASLSLSFSGGFQKEGSHSKRDKKLTAHGDSANFAVLSTNSDSSRRTSEEEKTIKNENNTQRKIATSKKKF